MRQHDPLVICRQISIVGNSRLNKSIRLVHVYDSDTDHLGSPCTTQESNNYSTLPPACTGSNQGARNMRVCLSLCCRYVYCFNT